MPRGNARCKSAVAAEAEKLVYGAREKDYGDPGQMLAAIGQVWSGMLGVEVSAEHVALMMAALKLVRQCHGKDKRDNYIDAVGYLLVAEKAGIVPTDDQSGE